MNRARLEEIVAAYGADPRRWPAHERAPAQALAAELGLNFAGEAALDRALALASQPAPPSDLLAARVLAATPRPMAMLRRAGLALAACMVGGVLLGYGIGASAPANGEVDMMLAAAFETPSLDWPGADL